MPDKQNHNKDADPNVKINPHYGANNPEPIEMKEDSAKPKQDDALHSALEYINGNAQ